MALKPGSGGSAARIYKGPAVFWRDITGLGRPIGSGDKALQKQPETFKNKVCTVKMSFRWYGDSDPVSLQYIRQIPGMHGIVSAVYDVPVGEVWPLDKILALKDKIEAQGMVLEV